MRKSSKDNMLQFFGGAPVVPAVIVSGNGRRSRQCRIAPTGLASFRSRSAGVEGFEAARGMSSKRAWGRPSQRPCHPPPSIQKSPYAHIPDQVKCCRMAGGLRCVPACIESCLLAPHLLGHWGSLKVPETSRLLIGLTKVIGRGFVLRPVRVKASLVASLSKGEACLSRTSQ